jgi:hypothetical protein
VGRKCKLSEEQQLAAAMEHIEGGKQQKQVAEEYGVSPMAINRAVMKVRAALDADGYVPHGQQLKGVSQYVVTEDFKGWIKTDRSTMRAMEAREAFKASLCAELPRAKPQQLKKNTCSDLATLYTINDYHFGQLSWYDETGEAWNLAIAEETFLKWFAAAIEATPDSEQAVLNLNGDLLHYDSILAITPTSKHLLDTDCRYAQMVHVVGRCLRQVVSMLLQKHQSVHVLVAEGNHDISTTIQMRDQYLVYYENEPRVTVDSTHIPFYCFEWGKTSLFFHHGHRRKISEVSKVFAAEYREVFGRTQYSYAHMGHLHHVDVKEDSLMIVEQHPTLAAKDAHASHGGYHSQRGANAITYSKRFGEIARVTIRPEMLQ